MAEFDVESLMRRAFCTWMICGHLIEVDGQLRCRHNCPQTRSDTIPPDYCGLRDAELIANVSRRFVARENQLKGGG